VIPFKSILHEELTDFLSIRTASMGKSALAHDKYYLDKFDNYLISLGCGAKELSEDIIIGWMRSLSGKSSSIANEVIVIRVFLKRLASIGIHVYIPPIPKVADDYVPYIFSDTELENIFYQSDNMTQKKCPRNPQIHLEFPMILRLLYGCGLRIGETLSLRMSDVDLDNGVLALRYTKGDKQRLVPMHTSLHEILRRYCMAMGLLGDPKKYLFPSFSLDSPVTTKTALHRFEDILMLTNITLPGRNKHQRGPCLHCLRHIFAFKSFINAELDGRGMNDAVPFLSIYLGHDSLNETEKYLKFSSELYPKAMELFEVFTEDVFPEVAYEE